MAEIEERIARLEELLSAHEVEVDEAVLKHNLCQLRQLRAEISHWLAFSLEGVVAARPRLRRTQVTAATPDLSRASATARSVAIRSSWVAP